MGLAMTMMQGFLFMFALATSAYAMQRGDIHKYCPACDKSVRNCYGHPLDTCPTCEGALEEPDTCPWECPYCSDAVCTYQNDHDAPSCGRCGFDLPKLSHNGKRLRLFRAEQPPKAQQPAPASAAAAAALPSYTSNAGVQYR